MRQQSEPDSRCLANDFVYVHRGYEDKAILPMGQEFLAKRAAALPLV